MQYKLVTAAMVGGALFALGAQNGIHVLHAQTKAPYYTIGEIQVQNEDGYKNEFLKDAQPKLKEAGATYIAGGFNKAKALTGSPVANRFVVLKWDSQEAADKWWATWGEKHQREVGNKYADFRIIGVEGIQ